MDSIAIINSMNYSGGTNIYDLFIKNMHDIPDNSRIFLITDGHFSVENKFLELFNGLSLDKFRLFILGVGYSPNYDTLNKLSWIAETPAEFIYPEETHDSYEEKIIRQLNRANYPILDVNFQFLGADKSLNFPQMIRNKVFDGTKMNLNLIWPFEFKIETSQDILMSINYKQFHLVETLNFSVTPTIIENNPLLHVLAAVEKIKYLEF